MSHTKILNSIFEISDAYENFIIDQWGVIHDGYSPYPLVCDVLTRLSKQKKKIILLSNSSKTKSFNTKLLAKIGFDTKIFTDIITSGEAFYRYRQNNVGNFLDQPAFYIDADTYPKDLILSDNIRITQDVKNAGWVMLASISPSTIDSYQKIFPAAIAKRLPLVCTNPDYVVVSPNQKNVMGPGVLAQQYEKMGGEVLFFGKPYRYVYDLCMQSMGGKQSPAKTLAIGDSLEHDIKGALDNGYDSLFIGSGIFFDQFSNVKNPEKILRDTTLKFGITPSYYMFKLF